MRRKQTNVKLLFKLLSNSSTSTHDFSVFITSRARPEYIVHSAKIETSSVIINLNRCRNSKLNLSLLRYIYKAVIKKANRRNGALSSPRINL